MSIPFSNTTTKNGIIQLIERNCGFNDGDISGNSTLLAKFTGDVNLALDKMRSIVFNSDSAWKYDDSNNTNYAIISTNIVAGQRDYSFLNDESGNLILSIEKVLVASPIGVYSVIDPIDVQDSDIDTLINGQNTQGQPTRYDKMANGILLDLIPSYNYTNGLKMYINREDTYFVSTDTTKKAGYAGIYHEYLALRPSYMYAYRNSLPNTNTLEKEMLKMEAEMKAFYGKREQDVKKKLVANVTDTQ